MEKPFPVFEIIAFDIHAGNSPYCNENTCHWQAMS